MTLFYISFATDAGFRGATVVRAENEQDALVEASFRGLNPGGEALILGIPESEANNPDMVSMLNRLVGADEMRAQGASKLRDQPLAIRERAQHEATFVCEIHNTGRQQ